MIGREDDKTLTPGERNVYLTALAQRCRKLADAVEHRQLSEPANEEIQNRLIGAQLAGIVLTGIALAGPQMREHFVDWVFARIRGYFGRCVACGLPAEKPSGADVCADCLADVLTQLKEAGLDPDAVF